MMEAEIGQPEHSAVATCAYCFKAEMRGEELVRMVPYKDGKANHGHSCVKGRFAYGYATHRDRILKPMIRAKVSDPWREVSWDEAFAYAASELKRIQAKYGKHAIGGITSSRCTMKRPTSSKDSSAPVLATTMLIPAPGSAIHRPAMASGQLSARRQEPKTSIRSMKPMW